MHHPKADVNRMYLPRRIGGRGLTKLETAYKSTTIGMETYLRNTDVALLQLVLQHETKKKLYSIQKEAAKFRREFEVPNLDRAANERVTKFAWRAKTEGKATGPRYRSEAVGRKRTTNTVYTEDNPKEKGKQMLTIIKPTSGSEVRD